MPYYKVKVKSFDTGRELWIALQAVGIHDAFLKANQYCTYTNRIYYPLEESLQAVTEEDYAQYMSKTYSK